MSRPYRLAALALAFLNAGFTSAYAGQVQVSFTDPERFADAGDRAYERDANLKVLAAYLQQLGARGLAADQTLKIEVTDVDLAGFVRPTSTYNLRIANGGADWPRITLRYALQSNGQTLRSGEETVADLNYLMHGPGLSPSDPLRHEKRMLGDWFDARFVEKQAAAR